jgi:hypothetical protein
MGFTLTVRDQTGAKHTPAVALPDLSDRITLRELIRTRVREEVAKANSAPLVQPAPGRTKPVDWQRQAEVALDGFGRNAFFVLVDGRQVEELDDELALTADSDVRFVKLVPLVGG